MDVKRTKNGHKTDKKWTKNGPKSVMGVCYENKNNSIQFDLPHCSGTNGVMYNPFRGFCIGEFSCICSCREHNRRKLC